MSTEVGRRNEQATRRGVAWSGKAFKRGFGHALDDRAPKRAPAAAYGAPPRSLTAAICGDPLPRQSALDRRGDGSP